MNQDCFCASSGDIGLRDVLLPWNIMELADPLKAPELHLKNCTVIVYFQKR